MSKFRVEYTQQAVQQLRKLDKFTAKLIYAWIDKNLQACENPRQHSKGLSSNKSGLWRYRVGDFRLISQIEDEKIIILIISIGHRRDIYRE